jgi:hypothetical protein
MLKLVMVREGTAKMGGVEQQYLCPERFGS